MFIVLLKFSHNKAQASQFMAGHNAWIQQGLDEGKFLVVGSLKPAAGGVVIAHGLSRAELEQCVAADPFVTEQVVQAEILEIAPGKTDPRLRFLLE